MDQTVTRWINASAGGYAPLDAIMIGAGKFGIPVLVALVLVQWWSRGERRAVRHVCAASGFAFLAGLALNQLILLAVHRLRPYDAGITNLIVDPSADWSFPSDHATACFAIAASFLLHGMRRWGLAFAAAAMLVAVSRIYVGAHYASDVLGGALTGIVAAYLVGWLYRRDTRLDRLITGFL